MLLVTLREDPAEAEIPSHKLLVRAGYIRRIGSGIYAYLPLMWRVLQKVSAIVREEMNAAGGQECLLPQLQPAELWQESGRWETYTKAEGIMFALKDRQDRDLGLGPTHEEVITAIARDLIRSYRQLPLNLYQIQTKFRDEIRPRFGLMRGREFIMKDAYSFDTDEAALKQTYEKMYQAYCNILRRCGLEFRAVEADPGAIGGSGSHEFMVLAAAGEDEVLYTEDGQYAANVEKATSLPPEAQPSSFISYEKRETPGTETIEKLCSLLGCSPTQVVKNILYKVVYANGYILLVLVSIRGDQEVNEVKLQNELSKTPDLSGKTLPVVSIDIVNPDSYLEWYTQPLPVGYIGPDLHDDFIAIPSLTRQEVEKLINLPIDLEGILKDLPVSKEGRYILSDVRESIKTQADSITVTPNKVDAVHNQLNLINAHGIVKQAERHYPQPRFHRIVDKTAADLKNFVTGANETGYHVVGANWGEQFQLPELVVDIRKAQADDRAVHDPSQILQTARGIEMGHIFQLGTKYSQALGATYTNEQGEEKPLVMGCYGIGVSRLAQAAVEQSYDQNGIIWPVAIAPYSVIVTVPNLKDAEQVAAAEQLYQALNQARIDTLLDDREERAGVKFKDADLIGIPYRIVTGRSLREGKVEVVQRASGETQTLPVDAVVATVQQWRKAAMA